MHGPFPHIRETVCTNGNVFVVIATSRAESLPSAAFSSDFESVVPLCVGPAHFIGDPEFENLDVQVMEFVSTEVCRGAC